MTWAPDYATGSELKTFVRNTITADDTTAGYAVTTASRAVDKCAGRQFGQVAVAEARVYKAEWDRHRRRYVVEIDDLATTTNLAVAIDGNAVTDYTLEPRNAVAKGLVWTELVLGTSVSFGLNCWTNTDVTITALWGWSSVPVAVKQATLLQGSRLLERRESPMGVAGSPTDGTEVRLLATVDPDVKVALGRYTRMWGAV